MKMDRGRNPLSDPKRRRPQTQMVQGGLERSQHGETAEAIFMNSGFVYERLGSC